MAARDGGHGGEFAAAAICEEGRFGDGGCAKQTMEQGGEAIVEELGGI